MGSVTLTASKAKYRTNFGPMLPSVYHSFYGDFDYLEEVLFSRIVSPDRGGRDRGGVLARRGRLRPAARGLVHATCASSATGTGSCSSATRCSPGWAAAARCGRSSRRASSPDIITSGKGIASGLPLGAMIAREDLMSWELGAHGSTYGGSPISCAAALATFDVIEQEDLLANARAVGDVLLGGLREIAARHPLIRDVRGRALWIGLGFADHDDGRAVEIEAFRRGLLDAHLRRRRDPDQPAARVPRGPGASRPRDLRGGRRGGRSGGLGGAQPDTLHVRLRVAA